MNIQPPILLDDANPGASTSAGIPLMDVLPTPQKYNAVPFTSMDMLTHPYFHGVVSVDISSGFNTQIFRFKDGPNATSQPNTSSPSGWHEVPMSIYSHVNYKREYIFKLIAPDEYKGRFAFHIFDYYTYENGPKPDLGQLRNRIVYWDIGESKTFSLTIYPFCNYGMKRRYRVSGFEIIKAAYWNEESDVAQGEAIRDYNKPSEINEIDYFAEFYMMVDQPIQRPPGTGGCARISII